MDSSDGSVEAWLSFFMGAGIPARVAADYAVTFSDNRMRPDMLSDINKDYLRDMEITTMGDVIAILKHAKAVSQQEYRARKMGGGGGPVQQTSAAPRAAVRPLPGSPARAAAARSATSGRSERAAAPARATAAAAIYQEQQSTAPIRAKRSGDAFDEGWRPVQPAAKRRPTLAEQTVSSRPVVAAAVDQGDPEAPPPPPPPVQRARLRPVPLGGAAGVTHPAGSSLTPAAAQPAAGTRFTITGLGPAPPTERQPFRDQSESTVAPSVRKQLSPACVRDRSPHGNPVASGGAASRAPLAEAGPVRRRVVPPPASSALDLNHLGVGDDLETVTTRNVHVPVQINRVMEPDRGDGLVRTLRIPSVHHGLRSETTSRVRLVGGTRQRAARSPIQLADAPTRAAPSPIRFGSPPRGVEQRRESWPVPAASGMRSRLKPAPASVTVRDRLKPASGATGRVRNTPTAAPRVSGTGSRLKPPPAETTSRLRTAPAAGVRSRLGASVRVTTSTGKVIRLKGTSVYSRLGDDR